MATPIETRTEQGPYRHTEGERFRCPKCWDDGFAVELVPSMDSHLFACRRCGTKYTPEFLAQYSKAVSGYGDVWPSKKIDPTLVDAVEYYVGIKGGR